MMTLRGIHVLRMMVWKMTMHCYALLQMHCSALLQEAIPLYGSKAQMDCHTILF